jgi:hypothetical protein
MTWSTDLHVVSWLDVYVAPKPTVARLVREQLLLDEERSEIERAIKGRTNWENGTNGLYEVYLSHTGLDSKSEDPLVREAIDGHLLRDALFDLTLGQRVKSFQLGHYYMEVHEIRQWIEDFVIKYRRKMTSASASSSLWWDGIYPSQPPRPRWISMQLREDPDFFPVLESWLSDSGHIQNWLSSFEKETRLVNSPRTEEGRVFSEMTAIEIMKWAKVRPPNKCQTSSISNIFASSFRENTWTICGRRDLRQSRIRSSNRARSSAYSAQECRDSPNFSSTTSPTKTLLTRRTLIQLWSPAVPRKYIFNPAFDYNLRVESPTHGIITSRLTEPSLKTQ